jgi:hypothetical protein
MHNKFNYLLKFLMNLIEINQIMTQKITQIIKSKTNFTLVINLVRY